MGRLNKTGLEPDALLKIEGQLFNALSRKESGELEGILRALMTEAEIEMLAKRVELLRQLSGKLTQEQIGNSLKVSSTTISQTRSKLRYNRTLQKFVQAITAERKSEIVSTHL